MRCAHTENVDSIRSDAPEDLIADLDEECSDADCSFGGCWHDSDDLLVCKVEFSFMTKAEQRSRLDGIVRNSVESGENVIFCGVDSPGTDVALALFILLIVVLLIAAIDGSTHSQSTPNFSGYYFHSYHGWHERPAPDYRCPAGTQVSVESRG
jgi:hypothetical protein